MPRSVPVASSGTVLAEVGSSSKVISGPPPNNPGLLLRSLFFTAPDACGLLTSNVAALCMFLQQGTVVGSLLAPGLHPGRGWGRLVKELSPRKKGEGERERGEGERERRERASELGHLLS